MRACYKLLLILKKEKNVPFFVDYSLGLYDVLLGVIKVRLVAVMKKFSLKILIVLVGF